MITTRFNSLLAENQQESSRLAFVDNQDSNSGIDFRNDSLLVKSKNDFTNAELFEAEKEISLNYLTIDSDRISNELNKLWNEYQAAFALNQTAKSMTNDLTKMSDNILEQLNIQSETILELENSKIESGKYINQKEKEKAGEEEEKNFAVNTHNQKIQNLTTQKNNASNQLSQTNNEINTTTKSLNVVNANLNNLNSNLSSVNSSISNLNSQINSLTSSLAAKENEDEKSSIQSQIASLTSQLNSQQAQKRNLEQQINAAETEKNRLTNKLNQLNSRKSTLENQIQKLESEISAEEKAKNNTITKYDNIIAATKAEIDTEMQNLLVITQQLAEEIYTQTGLTLQSEIFKTKVQEAQIFEQSTETMMQNTQAQIETKENENNIATEKTNVCAEEYANAKEDTTEKYNIYKQVEEELKVKYTSENQGFFA